MDKAVHEVRSARKTRRKRTLLALREEGRKVVKKKGIKQGDIETVIDKGRK